MKGDGQMATQETQYQEQIKTVCFTGHRNLDSYSPSSVSKSLNKALRILISHGVERFMAGGALGFDTLAALCVLELKEEFPHISLGLILPCKNQTKLWSDSNKTIYNEILKEADCVEYIAETYTANCMHDRNRRLVDKSDMCVAFFEHSGGGTAYTVAYALKQGKEVINIAELI